LDELDVMQELQYLGYWWRSFCFIKHKSRGKRRLDFWRTCCITYEWLSPFEHIGCCMSISQLC
jgi:hypothetical protein